MRLNKETFTKLFSADVTVRITFTSNLRQYVNSLPMNDDNFVFIVSSP